MKINNKIEKYNELTEAWLKGSEWLDEKGRTQSQLVRGEKRLLEILMDLSEVYTELKEIGVKVYPEKLLKTK